MLIEAGTYQAWEDFSLRLATNLDFTPGINYLSGANGSGKSSFLTRILLPRLLQSSDLYTVYFEQQMHIQVTSVKAYASIIAPHRQIDGEADTVDYLLDSLLRAYHRRQRPCCIVMDESLYARHIYDVLQANLPYFSLVYSAHTESFPATQTISFQALSPTLSEVHVRGS